MEPESRMKERYFVKLACPGRVGHAVAAKPAGGLSNAASSDPVKVVADVRQHRVGMPLDTEAADAMPGLFLQYGITSVRDTGGDLGRLTALRARLEASDAPSPRVFLAW